jgi:hypothetical protein
MSDLIADFTIRIRYAASADEPRVRDDCTTKFSAFWKPM